MRRFFAFSAVPVLMLITAALAVAPAAAWAQPAAKADEKEEPKEKEKKLPKAEATSLTTKDGVTIEATYYPSNQGKNAVPVIVLHGFKGSRVDMEPLAKHLHEQLKCAVIVPDLRGHGKSTKGAKGELDAATMKPADFRMMIDQDIESVKSFLMEKNNVGELNIEKLCVVGAEMGSTLALNWAQKDYEWVQLPALKQGRDVKALVLISPEQNFKGLNVTNPLKHKELQSNLSVLMFAGKTGGKFFSDAKRINDQLERFHPEPPEAQVAEKKTLFFYPLDTSLQGAKLLKEDNLKLATTIGKFIELRLIKKTFPWTDRKSPLN